MNTQSTLNSSRPAMWAASFRNCGLLFQFQDASLRSVIHWISMVSPHPFRPARQVTWPAAIYITGRLVMPPSQGISSESETHTRWYRWQHPLPETPLICGFGNVSVFH